MSGPARPIADESEVVDSTGYPKMESGYGRAVAIAPRPSKTPIPDPYPRPSLCAAGYVMTGTGYSNPVSTAACNAHAAAVPQGGAGVSLPESYFSLTDQVLERRGTVRSNGRQGLSLSPCRRKICRPTTLSPSCVRHLRNTGRLRDRTLELYVSNKHLFSQGRMGPTDNPREMPKGSGKRRSLWTE